MHREHGTKAALDPVAIRAMLDAAHREAREGYHEERRTRWHRRLLRLVRALGLARRAAE